MRWLVLLLVAANAAIFLWFSANEPENVRSVDEGRLPRVSEIEMIGQQGALGATPEEGQPSDAPRGVDQQAPEVALPDQMASEPEQGASEQCFGIGWFEEESHAEAYRRQLARRGLGVVYRGLTQQEEALEPFHWVIVPPLENREEALQRYRELVDRG